MSTKHLTEILKSISVPNLQRAVLKLLHERAWKLFPLMSCEIFGLLNKTLANHKEQKANTNQFHYYKVKKLSVKSSFLKTEKSSYYFWLYSFLCWVKPIPVCHFHWQAIVNLQFNEINPLFEIISWSKKYIQRNHDPWEKTPSLRKCDQKQATTSEFASLTETHIPLKLCWTHFHTHYIDSSVIKLCINFTRTSKKLT